MPSPRMREARRPSRRTRSLANPNRSPPALVLVIQPPGEGPVFVAARIDHHGIWVAMTSRATRATWAAVYEVPARFKTSARSPWRCRCTSSRPAMVLAGQWSWGTPLATEPRAAPPKRSGMVRSKRRDRSFDRLRPLPDRSAGVHPAWSKVGPLARPDSTTALSGTARSSRPRVPLHESRPPTASEDRLR